MGTGIPVGFLSFARLPVYKMDDRNKFFGPPLLAVLVYGTACCFYFSVLFFFKNTLEKIAQISAWF